VAQSRNGAYAIVSHEAYWRLRHGRFLPELMSPPFSCESVAEFQNFTIYRLSEAKASPAKGERCEAIGSHASVSAVR
jgi:hypothetical protein